MKAWEYLANTEPWEEITSVFIGQDKTITWQKDSSQKALTDVN